MDIHNKSYNNQLDSIIPISFSEYMNDKLNNIHNTLYNNALLKWFNEQWKNSGSTKSFNDWKKQYLNEHKLIELKNNDYYKPSDIIIYQLIYPYKKEKINLKAYWDNMYLNDPQLDISNIIMDDDTLKYSEIIYIDYVNGRCKLKSKLTHVEYWVPFKYINENSILSDTLLLNNTFSYLLNNLNN